MGIRDILKGSSEVTPKRANAPAPAKANPADEVSPKLANDSVRAKADASVTPSAGPDIADAFQVLLAEELGEVPAGQFQAYTIHVTDDLIDRISLRVLDRLTKGSLNETMLRIVTEVSERLVREEIARIRASAEAR